MSTLAWVAPELDPTEQDVLVISDADLASTWFIDADSPEVQEFSARVVGDERSPRLRAVRLFDAVRDGIWYDPFAFSRDPADFRASAVAASRQNWCVPKAVLLTASARAVGIPARLGFADVRNHFQTPRLEARMNGLDVFMFHGYSELHVEDRWVKATPAFNAELCARFGVDPIAFDGRDDALLHAYDAAGETYMEYLTDRGTFSDLPLDEMIETFLRVYGPGLFGADGDSSTVDAFSPSSPTA